jgi:phosphoglycolate phosphatase
MATLRCGNRQFSNIQAVIFDKDGTLQDSQNYLRKLGIRRTRLIDAQIPGIGEPLLMAFGIQNDTLDPTGLMAVGSHRENEIAAAAYIAETGRSWFESQSIAHRAFAEAEKTLGERATTSPLFAGSLEILQSLAAAGLKLGILSADTTANVRAFIKRHQLSDWVQLAMGVESGLAKPDPALFRLACEKLGVEPQFTLMVGDSAGDIQMAEQAGAAGTVGICWGNPAAAHLEAADVAIARLDELEIVKFET